jgi:MADS-box transcription factor
MGGIANAMAYRTFLKRKGGLFKKAHELSVLCSVDVAVIVFGNNKKLYEYSSSDIGEILQRHNFVSDTVSASRIVD